jgi:hypothetical protein
VETTSTRLHCATARQANEELMLMLMLVIESEVGGQKSFAFAQGYGAINGPLTVRARIPNERNHFPRDLVPLRPALFAPSPPQPSARFRQ